MGGVGQPVRRVSVQLPSGVVEVIGRSGHSGCVEVLRVGPEPLVITWQDGLVKVTDPTGQLPGWLPSWLARSPLAGLVRQARRSRKAHRSQQAHHSLPERADAADGQAAALRLLVPAAATVEVRGIEADVRVDGIRQALTVVTESGPVRAHDVSGQVQLRSASGAVDITGSGTCAVRAGTVHAPLRVRLVTADSTAQLSSADGSIDISCPPEVHYDVTADSVTGTVTIDGERLLLAQTGEVGGRLASGPDGMVVRAHTLSGAITFRRE